MPVVVEFFWLGIISSGGRPKNIPQTITLLLSNLTPRMNCRNNGFKIVKGV